jgi:hypothetical protein
VKKLFKLSEVMVGSGIRKKPIPDPGSGGQKGTGSRIRIRNTAKLYISENPLPSGGISTDVILGEKM